MPLEIRGKHLRVRVSRPVKGAKYRTQDVGDKHHSQRVAMYDPRTKRWKTQSWIFPLKDVQMRRKKTMKILADLGAQHQAVKLVDSHFRRRG